MQGKIIKGIAGFYYVYCEDSCLYECKARGNLRSRGITPLVGDDVEMTVTDTEAHEGSIEDILPRTNSLIRPALANVDRALIFFARNDPKPDMGLIDRLLITMERTGIDSIIVFNKSDLNEDESLDLSAERDGFAQAGYPVYEVCVRTGEGIDELKEALLGHTTAIAGPSGAGKSSFINRICPDADMKTGVISEKLGRGRHTTRHAEILVIDETSFIVDTPGFTSYSIDSMRPEELGDMYPEFVPFASECRFSGCSHTHEPGCRVASAAEAGEISPLRYNRYKRFYEELKRVRRY